MRNAEVVAAHLVIASLCHPRKYTDVGHVPSKLSDSWYSNLL